MFKEEDVVRVKHPCFPLYSGGELLQVDTDDYEVELRILVSTSQQVGHIDVLPRGAVENLFRAGVLAIENH